MSPAAAFDKAGHDSNGPATAKEPEPLRAVHTANFPALLRRLGASLMVTT